MEELKLNETPLRTARNYNINNIKLNNINIPDIIESFDNVLISQETEKDVIEFETSDISLKYGVGDVLLEQIKNEIPLNKIGKTKDIAKCVKWLIEDEYTTGQIISINGGWYI